MEKVTVVVPVYNRLEHLRALFICLLNQKVPPYELIISDDGSTQQIINYIGDLLEKAKFNVKYIFQKDKGFRKARALNNAVKEAVGDILVFCDQDLVFPDDYIQKMQEYSRKGEYIMSRAYSLNEEQKNIVINFLENGNSYENIIKKLPNKYTEDMIQLYKLDRKRRILQKLFLNKRGIRLAGMTYSLRKNDYIKVNGYDEKYQGWGYEDDDLGNRLCVAGIKGREMKTNLIQLHLYHSSDPSKKKSLNEEYYYQRKKEIFKNKDFFCKYGYNNSLDKDCVVVKILHNFKEESFR